MAAARGGCCRQLGFEDFRLGFGLPACLLGLTTCLSGLSECLLGLTTCPFGLSACLLGLLPRLLGLPAGLFGLLPPANFRQVPEVGKDA